MGAPVAAPEATSVRLQKSKHPFDIDAMLRIVAAIRHG